MTTSYSPKTGRGKIVYAIWNNLPRLVLLGLIILIAFFGFAIQAEKATIAKEKENAIAQDRPPVNTIVLETQPAVIRDRINLPGSIEPWTKLNIMAEVGGTITEIFVQEGDTVKAGDTLAKIDPRDYKISLTRAEAAYRLAKANYNRDRKVYAKGVIPVSQLEAQETSLQTARADMENAKLLLERCTIKAPISGVINRLDGKIGLLMSVGDPLAEILEINRVKAVIGIPESDIVAVRKLTTVGVAVKALEDAVFTGNIHFLASSPSNTARLYRLEIEIENHDTTLLPGMFIRADVIKKTIQDAIAIPFYSVISRNNEQYVFIEKDGVAEKRAVEMGVMENWLIEITSGLKSGDRVVIEGHRDIEDQQKIKVVKTITDGGDFSL